PLARRRIRANDRVIELARGELRLDREVAKIATVVASDDRVTVSPTIAAAALARPAPLIVATGVEGSGRATLLRGASARGTLDVRARELGPEPAVVARQLHAIAREARLFGVVPLLRELDEDRIGMIDRELLRVFDGPVLATATSTPIGVDSRPLVVHAIDPLSTEARREVWALALPSAPAQVAADLANS